MGSCPTCLKWRELYVKSAKELQDLKEDVEEERRLRHEVSDPPTLEEINEVFRSAVAEMSRQLSVYEAMLFVAMEAISDEEDLKTLAAMSRNLVRDD